jgi:glyoxylase-like metal-dependent hydrolase (beta-lactamase superfamily II)
MQGFSRGSSRLRCSHSKAIEAEEDPRHHWPSNKETHMNSSARNLAFATALTFPLTFTACAGETSTGTAPKTPAAAAPADDAVSQPLTTEVYNPGDKAIFAVTSVLVSGAKDVLLIDAQFSTVDAQRLVELIKGTGKRLTTIYISHGDPDFYFGLETLKQAFPEAKILATPQTIAHIKETSTGKLTHWGPILGAGAPKQIIVPEPLQGDLELEGQKLQVVGLDGPTPDRSFVWIPSIKTVAGGIPVMAGEHVWMADTQTPESHVQWLATLANIESLQPVRVIPGHFAPGAEQDLQAVRFTAEYIRAYDEAAAQAKNSSDLIAAMKRRYPTLGGVASLELSAKVSKGEMKWP